MEALFNGIIVVGGVVVRLLLWLVAIVFMMGVIAALYFPIHAAWRGLQKAFGFSHVGEVVARRGLFYSPGHTWLREHAGRLRVGLDDFARRLLPNLDVIELAPVGAHLARGERLARVRAGGRVVDIPSPMDGDVVTVNGAVSHDPKLTHWPYTRGWLAELRPAGADYARLPREQAASSWLRSEQETLTHRMETAMGIAGADGGEVLSGRVELTPDRRMELAQEFLQRV